MKTWWPALLIVLPGGSVFALAIYLRRRWLAREAAAIDALIAPPHQTFGPLSPKEYDAVRAEAARRYAEHTHRRQQAAQIASGKPAPLIRRVS